MSPLPELNLNLGMTNNSGSPFYGGNGEEGVVVRTDSGLKKHTITLIISDQEVGSVSLKIGEIKIEAKETSVAGYKKMYMHSNESAVINSKGLVEVKGEEGTSNTNVAEDRLPVATDQIGECIVEFRPRTPNYGKFGFDFMRIGDNAGSGVHDITYLGNMGTYAQNDYNNTFTADASPYNKFKGLLNGEFNPIPISVAEFRKTDIREKYAVPWLSLYRVPAGRLLVDGTPDPEADSCIPATLKLLIEVKTQYEKKINSFGCRLSSINFCTKF